MTTSLIYIAEDGTKFIDENDCRKYEELMKKNPNPGIILLDKNGSIIPLNKYNDAFFINITDYDIMMLKLKSIRVEEEFPYVCNIPEKKGYYSYSAPDIWHKLDKESYAFCTGMSEYNELTWFTCSSILINIHENNPNGFVKVSDVEGNVIYDTMPVLDAIKICINDNDNRLRKMMWYKEIGNTTYVIIY